MAGVGQGIATVVTDELVEEVAALLGCQYKKHEIKARIEEILDVEISPRSLETLIARARSVILERAKLPKSSYVAAGIEFWIRMLKDEKISPRDRIRAQEQLQNLLGVGGSFRAVDLNTPEETAQKIREASSEMDDAAVDATAPESESADPN